MGSHITAIPGNGVYVSAATSSRVDLSGALQRGTECIAALRKVLSDIPNKCKYIRSTTWSPYYRLMFNLGVNIEEEAEQYFHDNFDKDGHLDEIIKTVQGSAGNIEDSGISQEEWEDAVKIHNEAYWGYIHDITDRCNEICKEFTDETYSCNFNYTNLENRRDFWHNNAVLSVYDLTKKR